jgi:hypothetical protein
LFIWSEIWSFILTEHRWKVFENKEAREILGPERDKMKRRSTEKA